MPEVVDDDLEAEPYPQQVQPYVLLLQNEAIIAEGEEVTTPFQKVQALSKYTD